MKFRSVLPVAVLSVLVLALALTFSGSVAAAETATAVAQAESGSENLNTNSNTNHNVNEVRVNLDLGLPDIDLSASFTTVAIDRTETWMNSARIHQDAFRHAVGVNQASVTSGSGNSVSQGTLFVNVQNNAINIANENVDLGL